MTVTWWCRDSREMECHTRRLDLTCRPFQDRMVEIKIDYVVEIELPESGETPENVRTGYCGAYVSHFEDGGLSFHLPCFLLKVLAEIKMEFTQMAPNFFRYLLGCWVRAQEEGLEFGLRELKQLFAIKRNSGFPGTMILAPRGGRGNIEGIPNRDDRWRENFFAFKINLASFQKPKNYMHQTGFHGYPLLELVSLYQKKNLVFIDNPIMRRNIHVDILMLCSPCSIFKTQKPI
ncbi:hypothetical protein F2Q69_00045061 [Brassica cretica]|uniref:Uncharacterized protein n=1 Tax=Brassica cretica TaxID=69181 RepID=A0A8S9NGI7_BRACR|nr:hypothetical protein F2Q69_00045061 [Brassica cretica]